jgi:hypothetical protein
MDIAASICSTLGGQGRRHFMRKHRTSSIQFAVSLSLFILLFPACGLWARVTTPAEARRVVAGWLAENAEPFGVQLGRNITSVQTFPGSSGEPLYYLVRLSPSGFMVVSADDLVEPILGFADAHDYEPSAEDPLTALVTRDMNERIAAAYDRRSGQLRAQSTTQTQSRWRDLIDRASQPRAEIGALGRQTVSDVRVAPLLKTRWAQGSVCGAYCYNYYTPNNYLAGCVATAMAQVMYYHRYPTTGIGRRPFTIRVGGTDRTAYTRGGDGVGGPYAWDDMVPVPNCGTTLRQRQAIGALHHDAGLAVRTEYRPDVALADAFVIAGGFRTAFRFSSAVNGANNGREIGGGLLGMINPNLDAGLPVVLAIVGSGGHAVVADGYGYDLTTQTRTLYHHVNMGWGGAGDIWYNLPIIDKYNSVVTCIYNIFPEGTGEIISGRVLDASGRPIAGALVRATLDASTYETTTDEKGIYALSRLPSGATFEMEVDKSGLSFAKQRVATEVSRDWRASAGNRWGIDFIGTPVVDAGLEDTVDFVCFAFLAGGEWTYPNLADFAARWLTGVQLSESTPVDLPILAD